MGNDQLQLFTRKHIIKTEYKKYVPEKTIDLGRISGNLKSLLNIKFTKIHISSKSIKHIYDKHVYKHNLPLEFDFIISNLRKVTTKPELVITNKINRRGNYCFIKKISNKNIVCILELEDKKLFVVTAFILKDEGYLKGTTIVWKS